MAWVGHCTSHARQKMHCGSFTGSDFFSEVGCPGESTQSKTLTGQTEMQMPSPLQTSWSTATCVPWIPLFSGSFTSPLTACPLCSPVTAYFFTKSGSMGKSCFHLSFSTIPSSYLLFCCLVLVSGLSENYLTIRFAIDMIEEEKLLVQRASM